MGAVFGRNTNRIDLTGYRARVKLTVRTTIATLAPFPATIGSVGSMYVIVAPILIKEGHKEEFIKAMLEDAQG